MLHERPNLPQILSWAGWTLTSGIVAVACVLAISAEPADAHRSLDEAARHAAFRKLASQEALQRQQAKRSFPFDAWSQDDDVHAAELRLATAIARQRRVPVAEVLKALDDGMREGWPRPASARVQPTVPPCRPRPIY